MQINSSVKDFGGARDHRQDVAGTACDIPDRTGRAVKCAAELAHRAFNLLHSHSRNVIEAGHCFLSAHCFPDRVSNIAPKTGEDRLRNALPAQFIRPMLWLFVLALPVERKKHAVELRARLDNGDQCRISHLGYPERAETIHGPDQRFHFDRACSSEPPEVGEAELTAFGALNQSVPRKIVEGSFQTGAVPSPLAGL